jgi:hypothetical protein
MIFKAHTIGSLIGDDLRAETVDAAVHSSYDRTVNILGRGDLWLSIHPVGVPLHPFAVTIDPGGHHWPGGRFLDATPGGPCLVSESVIAIGQGNVRIDLEGARIWQSRLTPSAGMRDHELAPALDALRQLIEQCPIESVFLRVVLGRDLDEDAAVGAWPPTQKIVVITGRIAEAWRDRYIQPCIKAIHETIGLGSGLTPSGDDFLTGLLASSHFLDGDDPFRIKLFRSLVPFIYHTTRPSSYMLKAALDGHYPEPLATLLSSLGGRGAGDLGESVDAVLGIGATSGEDMLAGVLLWHKIRVPCGVGYASF